LKLTKKKIETEREYDSYEGRLIGWLVIKREVVWGNRKKEKRKLVCRKGK